MSQTKRERGFTLVELMVAVAIIGVLSSIAISGFMLHQQRSKRAEALTVLSSIADLEKTYFAEFNQYLPVTVPEPGVPAISPRNRPWTPANANFAALGFDPDGYVYYDYEISMNACGVNQDCFTATAIGDVDGDGAISVLQYASPNRTGVFATCLTCGVAGVPVNFNTGTNLFNAAAANINGDDF